MNKKLKQQAGHYEIQGETIAKFELFENGWNPYSRYLDVDKVDLLLRKRGSKGVIEYREIQVKLGTLFTCGKWEQNYFDVTTWRFFKTNEFNSKHKGVFIIYVMLRKGLYKGDLFVFPMSTFQKLIKHGVKTKTVKGKKVKVYLSRDKGGKKWYSRKFSTKSRFVNGLTTQNVIEITKYYRNFGLLK